MQKDYKLRLSFRTKSRRDIYSCLTKDVMAGAKLPKFLKIMSADSPTQSQQSQKIVYLDLASSACKFPNLVLNHSCASRRFSETCRKLEIELTNKPG